MTEKYIAALLRELKQTAHADIEAIKAELKRLGYDGPEVSTPAPKTSAPAATKEPATE